MLCELQIDSVVCRVAILKKCKIPKMAISYFEKFKYSKTKRAKI